MNDTSDEILSCNHGPFDPFPYAMRVFIILPSLAFGVGANVLNIMIFRHHRMRSSVVNWYLIVLAFSDLVVLLCSFLMLSLPAIVEEFNSLPLINMAVHVQRWTYAVGLMGQSCSVGMTVLVSGHKFFGVCFPFVAQRLLSSERVKICIISVFVFSAGFNLPRWLEISVASCYSIVYNTTGYVVTESPLRYDQTYYTIYMVGGYTLFMFVVPFVLLIFMNAMIIKTVHQSYLMRQHMIRGRTSVLTSHVNTALAAPAPTNADQNNQRTHSFTVRTPNGVSVTSSSQPVDTKENKSTIMLIAVVFMFLFCNCLAFINNILEVLIILRGVASLTDVYLTSVEISNFLVVLNSASNIFIYYAFSVKFRRLTKNYLCILLYYKKTVDADDGLGIGRNNNVRRDDSKFQRRSNNNFYNNNCSNYNDASATVALVDSDDVRRRASSSMSNKKMINVRENYNSNL